ncbi:MAG: hypothetical protein ACRD96_00725, partial [Bryobacteraceae bacterium]
MNNLFGLHSPFHNEDYGLTAAQREAVMDAIYTNGDHMMKRFHWVHAAIALALGAWYGTWLVTLLVTAAALVAFQVSVMLVPKSFFTRVVCGITLQTFVALHIYQMHGLAEMHFFFFSAFAMMIFYGDAASMWPGTALIILQHISFAILHNTGVQLYFFEQPYVSVSKLFFHFSIAIGHVAICGGWAILLRRRTLLDAAQRQQISESRAQLQEQLEITQRSKEALQETAAQLLATQ